LAFINKMLKIVISRFTGTPEVFQGKVRLIDEKLDEKFIEEYDTSNVEDPPTFRQECIERTVKKVLSFNYEEEQSAMRDKTRPKRRIRKLVISSIN